jgi:DNA-binding transcriptional LysR family regulator
MALGLIPNFANTAALRYFYEVARYGSFRLTAEKIHIAVSAVSRQIQLLEQDLGVKLFVRDRKGLRLTAAGEALLYRVKRVMSELTTARSEIDSLHGSHAGMVRIGLNDTVAQEFFPAFIKDFHAKYPNMRFEVMIANSADLKDALLRDEVDVVVGYAMELHSGMQTLVSYELKACIILRADHPLSRRKSLRVADVVSEPFIMPAEGMVLRQVIDAIFAKVAVKPAFMITTNSFAFIKQMVAEGFGIGCQLRIAGGQDPDHHDIVNVPLRDQEIKASVLACCISGEGTPSIAVSVFVEQLRVALDRWYGPMAAAQ